MATQFFSPFPHFLTTAGALLAGAKLFFYQAGTATKLDTFPTLADAIAGTNANANPVLLNALGQPGQTIFLKNERYKVVLAPASDTDPPTSPISTVDDYHPSNFTKFPLFTPHAGNPNGSVAGTAGSAGVLPSMAWDYTNNLFYVCTTTGTAATAVWTSINASAATAVVVPPQGYLTTVSNTPVITADQAGVSSVFYTPFVGNQVPIYNGASFIPTTFSELTLTLVTAHAANTLYDVFVFSNAGVPTLVTGPAWTNSGAGAGNRGTGASTAELARVNGYLVNAVSITGRNGAVTHAIGANLATYVGTILIDAVAGQVTLNIGAGQSRKWGVWNAYNRQPLVLKVTDPTASWTYTTADTWRQSNADSTNTAKSVCGLAEEIVSAEFAQKFSGDGSDTAIIGIGVNSTTAISGVVSSEFTQHNASVQHLSGTAKHLITPAIGVQDINCLERIEGTLPTGTHFGTEEFMTMFVTWRG